MARAPSDKTVIRNLKRELGAAQLTLREVTKQRDSLHKQLQASQTELTQWKERFDLLLKRDSKS